MPTRQRGWVHLSVDHALLLTQPRSFTRVACPYLRRRCFKYVRYCYSVCIHKHKKQTSALPKHNTRHTGSRTEK